MTSSEAPGMTGRMIRNRYELLSRVGQGGMGTVWLAGDTVLGRTVALKEITLSPYGEDVAVQKERALREARAAARIRHPAIVHIYDVFEEQGSPWIVMAYIEGDSLESRIEQHVLSPREIARVGRQVLDGLTAAHAVNVLHRDVKPANILVGREGGVVLVDFGIAQISGESGLTSRNLLLGTLEFMAPERINGHTPDGACDLWSLGITFFHALEGYSPFRRGNYPATLHAIVAESPPAPRRAGPLSDVIDGLLEKDPARRMTAAELDLRLRAILEPAPRPAPRRVDPQPSPRVAPKPAPRRVDAEPPPRVAPKPAPRVQVRREPDDSRRADSPVASTMPVRSRLPAPPSPSATPPPPALSALSVEEVRRAGPVAGGRLLLAQPRRRAASLLAAIEPNVAGPLLDGMAADPSRAVEALTLVPPSRAGRMLDHMTAEGAAELMRVMSPSEGAGILAYTGERVAAGILGALGVSSTAIRLVEAMTLQRACRVLEYTPPAVLAALLAASSDGRAGRLLNGLSRPVRAQIARLTPET